MILIRTNWKSFDEYIASLSKKTRYDYRLAMARYPITFELIPFDRLLVWHFMELWEQQPVRKKPIRWKFGVDHFEELANKGELLVFKTGEIGLQCVQKCDSYWLAHAPMYMKEGNSLLAKYMWFCLFRYFIEHKLGSIDMGGNKEDSVSRYKLEYLPIERKK